jgi:hypothetical protein
MLSSSGILPVVLTSTADSTQVLSSAAGSVGTYSFGIGGALPVSSTTKTGSYSGSFAVTVDYN